MIVGIGTDLVEIARIASLLKKHPHFATRVLTEAEQVLWQAQGKSDAYVAKRWAAKEAVLKALGTGLRKGMSFQDIEVQSTRLGAPQLVVRGGCAQRAAQLGVVRWHLSLSDEHAYALAYVIAEGG